MMEKNEHNLLKFLKDNEAEKRCFTPTDILNELGHGGKDLDTLEVIATAFRNLQARDLIIEKTSHAGDPQQMHSCYRITQKGLDELNPNTREKGVFKMQKITTALAIITTIASVITVIVVLTQF